MKETRDKTNLLHKWSTLEEGQPIPDGTEADCGFVMELKKLPPYLPYTHKCYDCYGEEGD